MKNNEENEPAKRKTKRATVGTFAGLPWGMKKQNPAARRVHAMLGKVNKRRLRRPNESIVCQVIHK